MSVNAAADPMVEEGHTQPVTTKKQPASGPSARPQGEPVNTMPVSIPPTPSSRKSKNSGGFWKRFLLILAGIVIVVLLGGAGSWLGYQNAVASRMAEEDENRITVAVTQYQMGLADLEAGRFETARQRFEYVVRIDPTFPGATEKLAQAMISIATQTVQVSMPTVDVTPEFTPTPDNRNVEDKFNSALALFNNSDWDGTIDAIMSMRKSDATFKAVEADGMLYAALRQRGISKIGSGQLEPGIYDLALAERFAPLDRDSEGFRSIARLYIIGASFWGVDWGQAYDYFKQVAAGSPGMVDSSGYTAGQRLAYAAAKYGDIVYGQGDYCQARDYYSQGVQAADIPNIGATATKAAYDCNPPTAAVTPSPTGSVTVAPTTSGVTPGVTVSPAAATPTTGVTEVTVETPTVPVPTATPDPSLITPVS
ncbi:MAG: hypothetical protein LWX83_17955 [Anaerolineae bacterium]|nr:hypothetical protein [Anaerolineae bacterium]